MIGDALRTTVLSLRIIPNPEDFLLRALNVPEGHRSLGLITTDCDDVSYAALDEATKKAEVSVAYARSMYAGSGNASTRLAGEFIGILSAPGPAQVRSGLEAGVDFIENLILQCGRGEHHTLLCPLHCPDGELSFQDGSGTGGDTDGLFDRTAYGGYCGVR